MPRFSLALLVALLAVGCADPAPDAPADPAPADTTASAPDTLALPPVDAAALGTFFDDAQVEAALAYDRAFRDAATGADLRAVYDRALALEATLLGPLAEGYDIWAELDRFREADLGLPGLTPTCVAECTMPAFDVALADWQAAAVHVGAPGAAAYFDALGAAYDYTYVADGRVGGWPAYQTQTWDYGGHSTLGSGVHADLLAQLAEAEGGPFADELATLRADVTNDVLTTACVGPSAEDAGAELSRIRDAGLLPDAADALDARIAAFARPGATGIEAGCEAGGCACEGG